MELQLTIASNMHSIQINQKFSGVNKFQRNQEGTIVISQCSKALSESYVYNQLGKKESTCSQTTAL